MVDRPKAFQTEEIMEPGDQAHVADTPTSIGGITTLVQYLGADRWLVHFDDDIPSCRVERRIPKGSGHNKPLKPRETKR